MNQKKGPHEPFWQRILIGISRAHIYSEPREALSRAIGMGLSYMLGVFYPRHNDADNLTMGIAFFLYSIATLYEFFYHAKKDTTFGRFIKFLFLGSSAFVLLAGFAMILFGETDDFTSYNDACQIVIIVQLCIQFLDAGLNYILPGEELIKKQEILARSMTATDGRLQSGNLGYLDSSISNGNPVPVVNGKED